LPFARALSFARSLPFARALPFARPRARRLSHELLQFGIPARLLLLGVFGRVIALVSLVVALLLHVSRRPIADGMLAVGFGIEAVALLAVVLIHFSTFHSFSAAIAAIIATAFVVVLVVAIAVSLVLRSPAAAVCARFIIGIIAIIARVIIGIIIIIIIIRIISLGGWALGVDRVLVLFARLSRGAKLIG
jgi:hypothetical protein